MSLEYDNYLKEHKANVGAALVWLQDNLPEVLNRKDEEGKNFDWEWQIILKHDASKSDSEEYDAYDNYFYGNKSFENTQNFNLAWLRHIHVNPHHWQHWVLINDDPKQGTICLDMPYNYIIEMICDWWSFSFKTGNLSFSFSSSLFSKYSISWNHVIIKRDKPNTTSPIKNIQAYGPSASKYVNCIPIQNKLNIVKTAFHII